MVCSPIVARQSGEGGEPAQSGFAVLKPYDPNDAVDIRTACRISGESRLRLIGMAQRHGLGRKVGARWAFSRVALHAFLNDDQEGLSAYLAGDRTGPAVTHAYKSAGVPLLDQRD